MSDPRDELADADVISSGGEDFGAFAASRWPGLVGLVRSRRARIFAVAVLAGLVALAVWLVPGSHPASTPAPPGQVAVTGTSGEGAGFVGPGGWWIGAAGCSRGRGCPRG